VQALDHRVEAEVQRRVGSVADGVDVATTIIFFLIRAVIALLPLLIFIVLPIGLITRFVTKRVRHRRLARQREENIEAAT